MRGRRSSQGELGRRDSRDLWRRSYERRSPERRAYERHDSRELDRFAVMCAMQSLSLLFLWCLLAWLLAHCKVYRGSMGCSIYASSHPLSLGSLAILQKSCHWFKKRVECMGTCMSPSVQSRTGSGL